MRYRQVFSSDELHVQGINILTHLLKKRLAFGGPVLSGPAKFLREKEIVEHDYCDVVTYTREDLKHRLTTEAERVSAEQVCMIPFIAFEGNAELIRLLDSAFSDRETLPEPTLKSAIAHLAFMPTAEIGSKSSF